MTRTFITLALILAVVLCPHDTPAQENTKDPALREKAFKVLESAAGQLSSLQSPENRARLGANIADSLWSHDEKRARALFALVEEDIRAGLTNRDLDDSKDRHTLMVFLKLRIDTVERIAKYDGELALAFLKATEFTSDNPLPPDIARLQRQRGLEMRLARLIGNNNPDLSLKLARQSLAQGVSDDLLQVLRQLNKRNKEQAMILYKEVVKKLGELNLKDDWSVITFATSLVYAFRPPTSNDPTFRELIGLLLTRALEQGCGNTAPLEDNQAEVCRLIASILPQLERIDPRAAQLKRWVRPADDDVYVAPEIVQELVEIINDGSIEDLLAFAAKRPDLSDDIYSHAVMKANQSGDYEQARRIATNRIADPKKKQRALDEIDNSQNRISVARKEFEEFESRLIHIAVENRINVLLSHAARFSFHDRTMALRLLKQASELADNMKPGREQTESRLAVATHYCFVQNDRGFVIMESLVPKLNELVDAAMKLDGYETGYIRDGEWNMSANGRIGALLTRLSENAGSFAWCDFDRAVSLAAQFERSEIRLMAQVKLAQAILKGPPKTLTDNYGYIR